MKQKKVTLFIILGVSIVAVGVLTALLLSPITSFLYGGSSDAFHEAGSCAGKEVEDPSATDDSFLVLENTATPGPVAPDATASPSPSPTIDPYETLYAQADTSMMQDIVNILLVGIDYSEERETWNGKKEWHSDVMMVLAVNFDENRADLISLPRDTYAKIPDTKGIYKLNAAINCGGGLYHDDGTFNPASMEKVMEAAEWMLGGIEVDYYYGVTMTSLKSLVDAFGGVDYDLDIDFNIQGRSYQKGPQHMDGQAVLDYCRVRKASNGLVSGQTGDANRVNRQKKILVAMYEQMRKDNLLVRIPDVLAAFEGELFTNCTAGQTAALAAFAYNLNSENIGMYSMSGSSASLFQWNFVFTDQTNRVEIIEEVYGVDVNGYSQYTLKYGRYRWCDMLYEQYMDVCKPLTEYVQKLIDEDDLLPEFTSSPTPSVSPSPSPTAGPTENATEPPAVTEPPVPSTDIPITEVPNTEAPAPTPVQQEGNAFGIVRLTASNGTPEPTRQYTPEQRALFEEYKQCLKDLEAAKDYADKEAKKARNGSGNQLNSASVSYIEQLAKLQEVAIRLATEFGYDEDGILVPYAPTATYWNSRSAWAVNYGTRGGINEVIVDFN